MQIIELHRRWPLFRAILSRRTPGKSSGYFILTLLVSVLLAGSSLSFDVPQKAAAQAVTSGQDTGDAVPEFPDLCVDGSQANTVFVKSLGLETDTGTFAYNWESGERTLLNSRKYDLCTSTGLLFTEIKQKNNVSTAWRFSSADPVGREVEHMPTNVPDDGTSLMYSVAYNSDSEQGLLWAGEDGGLTWVERGAQFNGSILNVAVSDADGRDIYLVADDASNTSDGNDHFVIYFSSDAGVTWEMRSTFSILPEVGVYTEPRLQTIPGNATPVDQLVMTVHTSYDMSNVWRSDIYVTSDGARTFQLTDKGGVDNNYTSVEFFHINEGLLRRYTSSYNCLYGDCSLTLSTDGGQNWQSLPIPDITFWSTFIVSKGAPSTILFEAEDKYGSGLYVSYDGGHDWQRYISPGSAIVATPYLPLVAVGVQDQHLKALEFPDAGRALTSRVSAVIPSGPTETSYFESSGHNLAPIFSDYWQTHGGLAQQGLPITEAFRELSPADGKVYTVQYFERAVFEYHPEKESPYKVLLGLLGVTAYSGKYHVNGALGQTASTTNPLKFAQTGHTIGGLFRQYWEENGGLAQQGYPISDEFQEQSVLDGKLHTVQYFERAVFELHLENAGTPYEILLGQLGRSQVEAKYGSPTTP